MTRLQTLSTRTLFKLSDVFAWVLFLVAAYAALASLLVDAVPSSARAAPSISPLLYTCILCIVVAVGAFALTRRRLVGLPLVMPLPVAFHFYSNLLLVSVYVVAVLLVFGGPFLLAFVEARHRVAGNAS